MLSIPYKATQKKFALVDCNNFYVSCEQVFNPKLYGRPVIVLSNNDGCIISRSAEAKAIGIPMGAPFFKFKVLLKQNNGVALSSNYALYGDMSSRVMSILEAQGHPIEIYSIDEAFLEIQNSDSFLEEAKKIQKQIYQWTGLPVSIGIGPSKTLAKVANYFSKKHLQYKGVMDLSPKDSRDSLLTQVPVREIWGIGAQSEKKLKLAQIDTALDFRNTSEEWIRKIFGVVGLRILYELKGISCLDLEEISAPKKQILSSRSFGKEISNLETLKEAIAIFTDRAAEKLRQQKSKAGALGIFIQTNKHNEKSSPYYNSSFKNLTQASSFTPYLIQEAHSLLEKIYRPEFSYKKAGIYLSDFSANTEMQTNLFQQEEAYSESKQDALMKVLDKIQKRWGNEVIHWGSLGTQKDWKASCSHRSGSYTTRWGEILRIT